MRVIKFIPALTMSSIKVSRNMESKLARKCSRRNNIDTSLPSPFKTPASSTAIYPAPTTATRFGCLVKAKKPSEVIPCSAPGTSGTIG